MHESLKQRNEHLSENVKEGVGAQSEGYLVGGTEEPWLALRVSHVLMNARGHSRLVAREAPVASQLRKELPRAQQNQERALCLRCASGRDLGTA